MIRCPLLWLFAVMVTNTWRLEHEARVKATIAAGGNPLIERAIYETGRRDARRQASRASKLR